MEQSKKPDGIAWTGYTEYTQRHQRYFKRAMKQSYTLGLFTGFAVVAVLVMILSKSRFYIAAERRALRQKQSEAWQAGFVSANAGIVRVLTVTEDFKALSLPIYNYTNIVNPYTK